MALQLFCGFESCPSLTHNMISTALDKFVPVTGRDGVGKGATHNSTGGQLSIPYPTPAATSIVGFGVWFATGLDVSIFTNYSESGGRAHMILRKAVDGRCFIELNGATLATSASVVFPLNTWHYVECKFTIADSGGSWIVKVNGVEVINYTGDTKTGGTGTTHNTDMLRFSFISGSVQRIDDLYIMDGTGAAPFNNFMGERVIKAKRAVGNGAVNQFLGSDGDSTDNYLLVDEDPLNITDYVSSNTAGHQDLYQLSAATGLQSVDAVQTHLYCSKSDSGARSIKDLLRADSDGTIDSSSAKPLSTTWFVTPGDVNITHPTGVPWTTANVNQIQAGIEVV